MRVKVRLLGIRSLRTAKGWRVELVYHDVNGAKHATDYDLEMFKRAVVDINVQQPGNQLEGLRALGITPTGRRDEQFIHQFADGAIGELGNLANGNVTALLRMLYRQTDQGRQLYAALDKPGRITLTNPYQ